MLLLAVACSPDPRPEAPLPGDSGSPVTDSGTPPPPPPPPPTGDTGQSTPPPTGPVDCVTTSNALRVLCYVGLDAPGAARVELVPESAERTRSFADPIAATDHEIVAWGLLPHQVYAWTAWNDTTGEVVGEGTVTTGGLPLEVLDLTLTVTAADPAAVGVDAVIFGTSCPPNHVVMADELGRVIWYQDVADYDANAGFVNAMTFTEDDTVLVEQSRATVREFDLAGVQRMVSVDFADAAHHELFKKNDQYYIIGAHTEDQDGTEVIVDTITVLDAAGAAIDSFSTADLYPYDSSPWMIGGYWGSTFPGALDFTHTNSVFVDDAGDVWLSFRHLHAFAKFAGGPGTPEFGALQWTAVGSDLSVVWGLSDFSLSGADPSFTGQHDVHLAPDGTVLLLDNGLGEEVTSQARRYAIDEGAHTLTELESWDLGLVCPVQGSVREIANGDVVVTCAGPGLVGEFAPGATEPSWVLSARCQGLLPVPIVRGIPVDLTP